MHANMTFPNMVTARVSLCDGLPPFCLFASRRTSCSNPHLQCNAIPKTRSDSHDPSFLKRVSHCLTECSSVCTGALQLFCSRTQTCHVLHSMRRLVFFGGFLRLRCLLAECGIVAYNTVGFAILQPNAPIHVHTRCIGTS